MVCLLSGLLDCPAPLVRLHKMSCMIWRAWMRVSSVRMAWPRVWLCFIWRAQTPKRTHCPLIPILKRALVTLCQQTRAPSVPSTSSFCQTPPPLQRAPQAGACPRFSGKPLGRAASRPKEMPARVASAGRTSPEHQSSSNRRRLNQTNRPLWRIHGCAIRRKVTEQKAKKWGKGQDLLLGGLVPFRGRK